MGHSCITQTAKYAKSTDKARSDAVKALEVGRLLALEVGQTSLHSRDKSGGKEGKEQGQTVTPNEVTH